MTKSGRKVLGILGGVGPLATAYFMETIIRRTEAASDQDHLEMVVLNHTEIPDRTAYILHSRSPDPGPVLAEDARRLESWGADVIVIPCNTAHYFYPQVSRAVSIPLLNMIGETAGELSRLGARRAGLLATTGTIRSGLYQDALGQAGIEPVLPSERGQTAVMSLIYDDIKAGRPPEREKLRLLREEFPGCDRIVLGCTELSLLKRLLSLDDFFLDALEVLAERSIQSCGKQVRPRP